MMAFLFKIKEWMLCGNQMTTPLHFDIGFLTNRISFSEDFWVGFHFQRSFISFY